MQNLKTVDFGVAFTLTRPAPADYEDKDGNTQTAAANEPRFNYSNGVAQGLLLDASLSETAAIDDVPAFNASAGHWIIDAEFYNSEPLKGMGLNERFSGSGKMVVSYSGGTAKVWAGGQAIYTVASYTPTEPTHICEGGLVTVADMVYKPSAISDADAAALATGDFEIYEWTPAELFEASQDGAWYDPSDLTTLFQDAAGTIPVTGDGDPVGLMLDKSGNGHHASQTTTASKPVYRTGGGLNWLEFDGADDYLVASSAVLAQPVQQSLGLQSNSTGVPSSGNDGSGAERMDISTVADAAPDFRMYAGGSLIANDAFVPAENVVLTAIFNGASSEIYKNAAQVASGAAGNQGLAGLVLGRLYNGTAEFEGRFYGVVITDYIVSAAPQVELDQYLAGKSGVSLT